MKIVMTAAQIAAEYPEAQLSGDGSAAAGAVASTANATANDLVFAEDEASLERALAGRSGVVLAPLKLASTASVAGRTIVFVAQPRLVFAITAQRLRALDSFTGIDSSAIDPSAIVALSAVLGNQVSIGPLAVVEDHVVVEEGVRIGAGAIVMRGTFIGAGTAVYPRVTIYPGTRIGAHCVIHAGAVLGADGFGYVRDRDTGAYTQFPQQGTLTLGDHVEVGANTTIDRGALEATTIGDGCKLDNLVHVGHNVRIGRNVVIAAQTGISGSSVIGDNAIIAGQVGIADHVTIGESAILGAQCGVPSNKKISGPGQLFWGTPARPIQQYLKELAVLGRLARKPRG